MKTTSLSIAIILMGFLMPVSVQAQEEDPPEKKSSLEIFFPVCDFLDESQTNWALLYQRPSGVVPDENILVFPLTIGVNYGHSLNSKESLRTSLLGYRHPYPVAWQAEDNVRGDIFIRRFFLASFGYQRNLFHRGGFQLSGLTEANLRVGQGLAYRGTYFWETLTGLILYTDLGLSLGLRVEQDLPMNFFFSGESKFTRYVFVNPNPRWNSQTTTNPVLPSQNTLTYQIALGYRF